MSVRPGRVARRGVAPRVRGAWAFWVFEPGSSVANKTKHSRGTRRARARGVARRRAGASRSARQPFRALAVGLDDGDVRVERLVSPPRGGGETGETGVPYARWKTGGGKQRRARRRVTSLRRGQPPSRPRGTTTTSAVVGGLLVPERARVGFVLGFSLKKKKKRWRVTTFSGRVARAARARRRGGVAAVADTGRRGRARVGRGRRAPRYAAGIEPGTVLGISVDGGVVGVSVTYARRDARRVGIVRNARGASQLLRPSRSTSASRETIATSTKNRARRRCLAVSTRVGRRRLPVRARRRDARRKRFGQKAGVDDDEDVADVRNRRRPARLGRAPRRPGRRYRSGFHAETYAPGSPTKSVGRDRGRVRHLREHRRAVSRGSTPRSRFRRGAAKNGRGGDRARRRRSRRRLRLGNDRRRSSWST